MEVILVIIGLAQINNLINDFLSYLNINICLKCQAFQLSLIYFYFLPINIPFYIAAGLVSLLSETISIKINIFE